MICPPVEGWLGALVAFARGARELTSVRILGPIEAWAGEQRLALGGGRQLTLFVFLLLNANRAVSTDALIDAVWGPERDGAVKRLQMAVMRLRRALEPLANDGESVLRTVSGGYLLSVGPGELDAEVFEYRMRDGRTALERGDLQGASDLLAQALALWRGPALAQGTTRLRVLRPIVRLETWRRSRGGDRLELCVRERSGRRRPMREPRFVRSATARRIPLRARATRRS